MDIYVAHALLIIVFYYLFRRLEGCTGGVPEHDDQGLCLPLLTGGVEKRVGISYDVHRRRSRVPEHQIAAGPAVPVAHRR